MRHRYEVGHRQQDLTDNRIVVMGAQNIGAPFAGEHPHLGSKGLIDEAPVVFLDPG